MTAPPPDQVAPHRVLIVKPSSLGDVVAAVPVLRGLRRTFPQAHVSWLVSTGCAAIVEHDRDLDEVILFDRKRLGQAWRSASAARELQRFLSMLRAGAFDWVIDLQGLLRSALFAAATRAPLRAGFTDAREGARWFYTHRIAVSTVHTADRNIELAERLGIDARGTDMTLEPSAGGAEFATETAREHGLHEGEFLVCVPPTRWATKRYPVRHWRSVVRALSESLAVVLLGTPSDIALCARIAEGMPAAVVDLAGKTDVQQMVGMIAASAGVICCDSAAKFIAPAVGVDAVVLIGPTRVDRTGPYLRGRAIVADVPCQGCLKKRCGHATCMQMIDPGDVVSEGRRMLANRRAQCP